MIDVAQRRALWRLPISALARILAALICDVQTLERGRCDMSLATFARETSSSRPRVISALAELRPYGLLEVQQPGCPTWRSIDPGAWTRLTGESGRDSRASQVPANTRLTGESPPDSRADHTRLTGESPPDSPASHKKTEEKTEQKTKKKTERRRAASGDVESVFEWWKAIWRKSDATKLTPKRRKLIERAIKGYGVDAVKRALEGYSKSDWHRGQNPNGVRYDSIELHLRDAEKIERGIALAEAKPRKAPTIGEVSEFGDPEAPPRVIDMEAMS